MKIKKVNNPDLYTSGHLLDVISVGAAVLINLFGNPIAYPKDPILKTDWEWVFEFQNGEHIYLYDYKVGKNYLGEEDGLDLFEIDCWHIGGNNKVLATKLKQLISSKEWSCFDQVRLKMFFTEECLSDLN
jgi:hypothetical protein